MSIDFSADLVEATAGILLSGRFDNASPIPDFHRECWDLYCTQNSRCGVVAPRGHAKSTALTFSFTLAAVLFRRYSFVILVGSTEDKANEQLSNLIEELTLNEDIKREFGLQSFETVTKSEIIVRCDDGHRFRIMSRGAEQKIRGAMWNGKRPDLIICDDMEDDEQVMNADRRKKFRNWFFRAVVPALSMHGHMRVHGTILHEDSLLARLMKNPAWTMLFYKAHNSYSDFTGLLWPERWTEEKLRSVQMEHEGDGDSAGYSQEYLNTPLDDNETFLKKENFLPMVEEDYLSQKIYIAGTDWAISKKESANRTSFTCGGKDVNNIVHVTGQAVGRWDSQEIIDELFDFYDRWKPVAWYVETGQIWLALKPLIMKEMQQRDTWINFVEVASITDKASRARIFQKRHKAGGMRFDKQADWYAGYEAELLTFTGVSDAKADDQFDSTALMMRGFEEYHDLDEEDLVTEDEWLEERESRRARQEYHGRTKAGY